MTIPAACSRLQRLSPIEIRDYLRHDREQVGIPEDAWDPVTDQIAHQPDGPLATALRTPWILGLAAMALRGDRRTATRLAACRDTTEIQDRLFAALIPAAIHGTRRTGPTRDYTAQKVQTWMRTLAQHLERRRAEGIGGTEIALGEVWALAGTRRCRALHALAVGLAVAIAAGLPGALAGGLAKGLALGLVIGLPCGIAAGLMPGLPAGLTANVSAPKRFAWRVPGRSRWRRGLAVGLAAGLLFGIAMFDWFEVLMVVLGVGLSFGLTTGLGTNADDRLALGQHARRVIHDDHGRAHGRARVRARGRA